MQAMDQIINSAAKNALYVGRADELLHRVPRSQWRGLARRRPAQPRTMPPGMHPLPGMKVIAPYSAADAKGLLKAANPRSQSGLLPGK